MVPFGNTAPVVIFLLLDPALLHIESLLSIPSCFWHFGFDFFYPTHYNSDSVM